MLEARPTALRVIALGGGRGRSGRDSCCANGATAVLLEVDVDTAWQRAEAKRPALGPGRGRVPQPVRGAPPLYEEPADASSAAPTASCSRPVASTSRSARSSCSVASCPGTGRPLSSPTRTWPGSTAPTRSSRSAVGSSRRTRCPVGRKRRRRRSASGCGTSSVSTGAGSSSPSAAARPRRGRFRRGHVPPRRALDRRADDARGAGRRGHRRQDGDRPPAGQEPRRRLPLARADCDRPGALETLPEAERRAGMAEVVKTGLLAGEPLWELPDAELVRRCAVFKTAVCLRDPHDHGERSAQPRAHVRARPRGGRRLQEIRARRGGRARPAAPRSRLSGLDDGRRSTRSSAGAGPRRPRPGLGSARTRQEVEAAA